MCLGTLNVRCSSRNTRAIVKWLTVPLREKNRFVISVVLAVHSELLALTASSWLQESAFLLRPDLTQFFLNMQTFVFTHFYYHFTVFTCNILQHSCAPGW